MTDPLYTDPSVAERLVGALIASDSAAHCLEEALKSMTEARFLFDSSTCSTGSLLERSEQAIKVLEAGIASARYALNLTDVEPG